MSRRTVIRATVPSLLDEPEEAGEAWELWYHRYCRRYGAVIRNPSGKHGRRITAREVRARTRRERQRWVQGVRLDARELELHPTLGLADFPDDDTTEGYDALSVTDECFSCDGTGIEDDEGIGGDCFWCNGTGVAP